MIVQRLARSLSKQHWGTVLLEILIVVVGIFLGLQVDDWNQQRKDRVDEGIFLNRVHDDLLVADELSSRLRQRRQDRLVTMISAADVLMGRGGQKTLTDDECGVLVWSTAFNINAPVLPSVDELIGSGRMGIIRDSELRTALVALRQTRAALDATITEKSTSSNFTSLTAAFPEFFKMSPYFDEEFGEIRTHNECDLEGMRANQPFLNQFSANADGYDAYIRDGLRPWSQQFERVHDLVDHELDIDHPAE